MLNNVNMLKPTLDFILKPLGLTKGENTSTVRVWCADDQTDCMCCCTLKFDRASFKKWEFPGNRVM